MKNLKLRQAALEAGVPLWMIGERMGVTDATFSRWLRKELDPDQTNAALEIIEDLRREQYGE